MSALERANATYDLMLRAYGPRYRLEEESGVTAIIAEAIRQAEDESFRRAQEDIGKASRAAGKF